VRGRSTQARLENRLPQESGPIRGRDRLTARDARVLLLWLVAGLAGAGIAYRYFFNAFPEAAVQFKVTRAQALDEARRWIAGQGVGLDAYQAAVVFEVDDDQKTYLERELGLEQANRLMSSEVNVWFWDARFFKPLQKEEFRVRVDPGGRIVGYDHVLEEAAPGARLSEAEARARAEQFLRDTLHTPLAAYTFLPEEVNSIARPNRTDWAFTWERTGFRAKDAPYRLRVTLLGDTIGGYQEFLKVPEAWQRSFARLRSSNDLIETVALIPYALLLGAALSVTMVMVRSGHARWGSAIKLGLFIMGLYFVMQLNQWPLTRASYDTNSSYSSFVAGQMGLALGSSFLLTLLVVIAFLPGEPLYRAGQPDRLRLGSAFTLRGLQTKEFFRSGVIGICLAGAHIGYIVLFYIVGRRMGIWAPQDLQYSDTLSTALPWIYPLTIGIYAAASEEFLFRLFSVRFLLRVTKSQVLAVVIPAFAWGFLHSNYPQEPAYIRGIEVGLIGIVAGLVMLRWGIVATLTWHYSVDAFLISLSLMRSADLYSRISGTIVGLGALIPVGAAGVLYLARGGFADQAALLNSAEPLVEATETRTEPATARPALSYEPLKTGALAALGVFGALGLLLLWGVKPRGIGDFVKFSIDARQAESDAAEVLRQRQVDPSSYRQTATIQYTFDPLVNEFLRRSVGVEGANRIYRDQVPSAFWTVRYFRDAQKEEYLVVLRPGGGLHSVHHVLAENTPGANLSKEDALAKATAFLRDTEGLDPSQWRLVESNSDKLPARTDQSFTWEQIAALTPATAEGEAHERVQLQVQGDEVSGYRVFIHVPEDWTRKQEQTTLTTTARIIGLVLLVGSFAIAVLAAYFRNLKQFSGDAVPWRRLATELLVVLVAAVAMFATLGPQYLANYSTQVPFRSFVGTAVIGVSFGVMLLYAGAVFLFGLTCFFLMRAYGGERLPGWRNMPAPYYRDTFAIGLGGSLALMGWSRLPSLLARIWVVPQRMFPARVPGELDFSWPAVHAVGSAVSYGFVAVGVLTLASAFALCYLRGFLAQAALLAVCAVLLTPQWGSIGDFAQKALVVFAGLALIWWGSRRIAGLNLLGYLVAAMVVLMVSSSVDLLSQPNSFFRGNGWTVAGVTVALLLWPLSAWQWKARNQKS
jgi:hypothetical protein